MAYQFGSFVWFELVVPDIDKATRFYPETVGWQTSAMDMGDFKYTLLARGEDAVGGVVHPQGGPQPAHWAGYLSVPDVDAACKTVLAHGGKVLAPAFDVPTVGTMAPIADPQGATLFLFKGEKAEDRTDGMHWMELWAKDAPAVLAFYKAVANATAREMPMPDGTYFVLETGDGRSVGGVRTSPDAKVPPMWLPYIAVDDVDATVTRAVRHGGKVIKAADAIANVGRVAIVADDQGAVVGLITPTR